MKYVTLIVIGCVILFSAILGYKIYKVPDYPVHYHINFAAYIDDKQLDFSKPDHMDLKPCTKDYVESDNKEENIHLHDLVGNVIHIHQDGVTWNDIFNAIRLGSEVNLKEKKLHYYINGVQVENKVLESIAKADARILISTIDSKNISDNEDLKKQYESTGTDAKEYDSGLKGVENCSGKAKRTLQRKAQIAWNEVLQFKL